MRPYYEDDHAVLYHGDCLEVLANLPSGRFAALLTDPPYFQVKDDAWDNQWDGSRAFLNWMESVASAVKKNLTANASIWVFASPAMTSSVEQVIGAHYRLLNSIRWVKYQGWHQKAELSSLRSFLTPWEGIVFAEQFADQYGEQSAALHKQVFAPIGRYIQQERERAGWRRSDVEVALGYVSKSDPTRGTALCYRWEEGSSLPTAEAYGRLREVLNSSGGEYLSREYDELRREYDELRRPFRVVNKAHATDIWDFPTVAPYPGKHPCEKPQVMLRHMLEVSTRPNDTVLDLFAGSGSTLIAARDTGRKCVGVELEERYCELIAKRLAQGAFDFGDAA
ncbi:DNA-methyltransferase [Nocardia wallacei]|uniref:DNA-methyltransferase n=1 Tax=Nocardia wallacei TaxID=480035 RepID=UPI0024576059|nr:site-specific DNA-methyltransferase [Nocardia wallacei]